MAKKAPPTFAVWLLEPEKKMPSIMSITEENPIFQDILFDTIQVYGDYYMIYRRPGTQLPHNRLASALVPGKVEGSAMIYHIGEEGKLSDIGHPRVYSYLYQQVIIARAAVSKQARK